MNKTHFLAFGMLALAGLTSGCMVRAHGYVPTPTVQVQAEVAPPPPVSATITVGAPPATASGVIVVEQACTQGAQEQCNGLDDNCNGQIDEGCGYQSGAIQITLAWPTGADIDMYVTDPAGQTISYQNTSAASGGQLDRDARGACVEGQAGATNVENVFWNTPTPPSGTYRVQLHNYSGCGQNIPTTATVSISVGGRIIGTYQYALAPDQRVDLASFSL